MAEPLVDPFDTIAEPQQQFLHSEQPAAGGFSAL
jgi:hypothetical protein